MNLSDSSSSIVGQNGQTVRLKTVEPIEPIDLIWI